MQPQPHIPDETLPDGDEQEREMLSGRISLRQIRDCCLRLRHDERLREVLFRLLDDTDKRTADNAAWILTHLDDDVCRHFSSRFDDLAEKAMHTKDETLRRLLLTLIYRLPFPDPPHVGLLNFCLTEMMSCRQPNSVRSLCMKIAYETCLPFPEMREEIGLAMDIMEQELLPPSLRCVRKNILTNLKKRKSLRS